MQSDADIHILVEVDKSSTTLKASLRGILKHSGLCCASDAPSDSS